MQTASGLSTTRGISGRLSVTPRERDLLRELARHVAEIAARPQMEEKARLWTAHNDLRDTTPLVFIDPENGWNEIILQKQILCEHPLLRVWEMALRKQIHWAEEFKDDKVIEPFFDVPYNYDDTGWGLVADMHGDPAHGGSYVWDAPIQDYERDLPRLKYPEIIVDHEQTRAVLELAQDLFGDILTVRLRGVWYWTLGMTWEFITLRGLSNFMLDMYDNPEGVHRLMTFLRDGTLAKMEFLEREGLLALNTEGTYVGSGGFGWTEQLPAEGFNPEHVRMIDMWGFGESQETVGTSPEMFAEFILPYQKSVLERFGLNCYGCCEPLHGRWDHVKTIPRLRRVSSSPWADRPLMAEQLGRDYIFSVKPSPTPLAFAAMDEDEVRRELREVLSVSRDSFLELMMKDNHTLGGNPENASRWVEIAREEIDRAR
ncbi:MAG: hypothetical protein EA427_11210 [Spirochaetaceae bacterium]|nr:MAG: hypothetical protein EA427_11210 [Spirochaetaceae bacterium]